MGTKYDCPFYSNGRCDIGTGSMSCSLPAGVPYIQCYPYKFEIGREIKDAQEGMTPLHNAVLDGRKDKVRLLITQRANVNAKDNHGGWTPLHYAAVWGLKEIAEILIVNGANVNAKTNDGETPLFLAKDSGRGDYEDVIKLLIAHGAKEK